MRLSEQIFLRYFLFDMALLINETEINNSFGNHIVHFMISRIPSFTGISILIIVWNRVDLHNGHCTDLVT